MASAKPRTKPKTKKPAKQSSRGRVQAVTSTSKPKPTQYTLTIPKALLEQANQTRGGTITLEDHLLELLQRGIFQVQQRQQQAQTQAAPEVNPNLARNITIMQRHYGGR